MDWEAILAAAAAIVRSYDTGVTLRQLFYRLVASQMLPNTPAAYKGLSRYTVRARRAGTFPSLIDQTRSIRRLLTFEGPDEARRWLAQRYRRDRTEGQPYMIFLGVEKRGMVNQLASWFGDDLGIPILPLGGYSSEPFERDVVEDVEADGRPAVLLYAGDWDPSGEDIDRNFLAQTRCFSPERVVRVALSLTQVEDYGLPEAVGKVLDSRAKGFVAKYGRLAQVELDALDPDDLRALFAAELERWWDDDAYEAVLRREESERQQL